MYTSQASDRDDHDKYLSIFLFITLKAVLMLVAEGVNFGTSRGS